MSGIFKLPTALPAPSPVTHLHYQPLYPTDGQVSDVDVKDFIRRSQISFLIQPTGRRWWVPSRSYMRVRFELTQPVGATNQGGVNIGTQFCEVLGASPCAALFRGARFMVGTQEISVINNFLPQINAMKLRTSKSGAYLRQIESKRSGFVSDPYSASGQTASNPSVRGHDSKTYNQVTARSYPAMGSTDASGITNAIALGAAGRESHFIRSDIATTASRTYTYEFLWTPPLGIFDYHGALPGADYRLELHPDPDALRNLLIATMAHGDIPANTTDALRRSLKIVDMEFHVCEVEGPRGDDEKFVLDIADWQMIPRQVQLGENASIQESYTLPMATEAVAFAMVNVTETPVEASLGYGPQFFYNRIGALSPSVATTGDQITGGGGNLAVIDATDPHLLQYAVWHKEIALRQSPYTSPFSSYYIEYGGRKRPLRTPDLSGNNAIYSNGIDFEEKFAQDNLTTSPFYNINAGGGDAARDGRAVVNKWTEEWQRTHQNTGLWFTEGGCETYEEWNNRGPFLYFRWPRDGTNNATRLNFFAQCQRRVDYTAVRAYLGMFALAKKGVRITTQGSRVLNVEVSNRTKRG
jgi:hypothetical protein